MDVPTVLRAEVRNYGIEGPTRKQAHKMAAWRRELLTRSAAAMDAGQHDRAFELDCMAFDVEADLIRFGFCRLVS